MGFVPYFFSDPVYDVRPPYEEILGTAVLGRVAVVYWATQGVEISLLLLCCQSTVQVHLEVGVNLRLELVILVGVRHLQSSHCCILTVL